MRSILDRIHLQLRHIGKIVDDRPQSSRGAHDQRRGALHHRLGAVPLEDGGGEFDSGEGLPQFMGDERKGVVPATLNGLGVFLIDAEPVDQPAGEHRAGKHQQHLDQEASLVRRGVTERKGVERRTNRRTECARQHAGAKPAPERQHRGREQEEKQRILTESERDDRVNDSGQAYGGNGDTELGNQIPP